MEKSEETIINALEYFELSPYIFVKITQQLIDLSRPEIEFGIHFWQLTAFKILETNTLAALKDIYNKFFPFYLRHDRIIVNAAAKGCFHIFLKQLISLPEVYESWSSVIDNHEEYVSSSILFKHLLQSF